MTNEILKKGSFIFTEPLTIDEALKRVTSNNENIDVDDNKIRTDISTSRGGTEEI